MTCVVAVALATAGCGGRAQSAPGGTITVLAAASLAEAFGDLGSRGGPKVTYGFGGSQQLMAQVEAGAPADVVATADPETMARLVGAGLVETPIEFARNWLAIAVGPGNPRQVQGLNDLGRGDLRVVLADRSVPVGRYGLQSLDRAGVEVRPVSFELDVKSVAAKVRSGEADAGIVYATDVPASSSVAIPEAANVAVSYPVAVVRGTPRGVAAQAFVDRLLGPAGRAAMAGRGFLLP